MRIERAAVIGAGVMGSGIAAQLANAGIPTVLLDLVKPEAADRSAIARGAIDRLLTIVPAAFMTPGNAALLTPGNLDDDLGLLAGCDLIIEAVVERLDVKQALYAKIDAARRDGSIVTSNTSTIPLAKLTEGLSPGFRQDFLISHFFNPPRYMRLLELVAGPETRADAVQAVRALGDHRLGKGVVLAKDRPGFIANRIGTFWMEIGVNAAMDQGLTVEDADAIMGRPFGIPRTGVFGLLDLIGIDLMPHVARSLLDHLPAGDAYRTIHRDPKQIRDMIESGLTGRKGKGGFQRVNRASGTGRETIDLVTGVYRPECPSTLASARSTSPGAVISHPDPGGDYARRAMIPTLVYAAGLVPEIADTVVAVDEAMRLGYNWRDGPFQLIDRIGAAAVVATATAQGLAIPPLLARLLPFYRVAAGRLEYLTIDGDYAPVKRPPGVILLEDVKRAGTPLLRNAAASLWDIGDGVACLEFHSTSNTIDTDTIDLLARSIALVASGMTGLVIYNEADNFSLGANIRNILFAANLGRFAEIDRVQASAQAVLRSLKFAPFPTVAAPAAMTLGGGAEICLHASAIQAHAELYLGLAAVGIGVVPCWGGITELLLRLRKPEAVFATISTARVSRSAAGAQALGFLRDGDGITMNRDRLLADAKARVLALAPAYRPPAPATFRLADASAAFARQADATQYDIVIGDALSLVLSGNETEVAEDRLLALERAAFLSLIHNEKTLARIEHMLETGKPLRN